MEIKEAVDMPVDFTASWLVVAKTMRGYVVYQEHPTFNQNDRVPRPLAAFETKKALLEWMAQRWMPEPPEHEFKCR